MGKHDHLPVETPAGNLVAGMKWLPGVHTQRFNRYIHLHPARAGLVRIGKESLKRYRWSSYPRYLSPAGRGTGLAVRGKGNGSSGPPGLKAGVRQISSFAVRRLWQSAGDRRI